MADKKEITTPEIHGAPETVQSYGITATVDPNARRIRVRSNLLNAPDGGARLALSERDPSHPGGEAFIAGPGVFEVGNTPGVNQAIRDGRLVPVTGNESPAPPTQ